MWSWRESNPRPNRETIRFLHAYSSLWFSSAGKTWTTNRRLILKIFISPSRHELTIPEIPAPLGQPDSEQHQAERCLVPSPGDGIKPVIYCTSIRQRERNCFRQLIVRSLSLRSKPSRLRVLTYHLSRRQIQSSPIVMYLFCGGKDRDNWANGKIISEKNVVSTTKRFKMSFILRNKTLERNI